MITPSQFISQSHEVARLRYVVVKAQIELKRAEHALEQHEWELLSANPPQGSNDAQRKLDRERTLRMSDSWTVLDEAAFAAKSTHYEAEAQLEAEKDILQGLEWAIRCEIARNLDKNVSGVDSHMANVQVDKLPEPPPFWDDYYAEGGH